jgi:hypothetical protein
LERKGIHAEKSMSGCPGRAPSCTLSQVRKHPKASGKAHSHGNKYLLLLTVYDFPQHENSLAFHLRAERLESALRDDLGVASTAGINR